MSSNSKITDRRRTLIFINILIACIASSMLSTALTTALLPIMKDLHVSVATGQWLTSGYSLAMGIIMPLTAFLITRFPTKKLYLTGIGLFIAGLVICALAPVFPAMMCASSMESTPSPSQTVMQEQAPKRMAGFTRSTAARICRAKLRSVSPMRW